MTGAIAPTRSALRSLDGTAIAYDSFGAGKGVIVIGGALRTGRDYVPFARALARSFAVHVIERRGRGSSCPQGPDYSIAKVASSLPSSDGGGLADLCTSRAARICPRTR
jgi:predicted alpha/beta hydrolase